VIVCQEAKRTFSKESTSVAVSRLVVADHAGIVLAQDLDDINVNPRDFKKEGAYLPPRNLCPKEIWRFFLFRSTNNLEFGRTA
jgi:hypothetical protein